MGILSVAGEIAVEVVVSFIASLLTYFIIKRIESSSAPYLHTQPLNIVRSKSRLKRLSLPLLVGLFCLLLSGSVTYAMAEPNPLSSCPVLAKNIATITYPQPDQKVQRSLTVTGTSCHIESGHYLWLLVLSTLKYKEGYFVQSGPLDFSGNGEWSAPIYIGDQTSNSIGHSYKLIPVISDQSASQRFNNVFKDPYNWQRLIDTIPSGTEVMPDILVTRE